MALSAIEARRLRQAQAKAQQEQNDLGEAEAQRQPRVSIASRSRPLSETSAGTSKRPRRSQNGDIVPPSPSSPSKSTSCSRVTHDAQEDDGEREIKKRRVQLRLKTDPDSLTIADSTSDLSSLPDEENDRSEPQGGHKIAANDEEMDAEEVEEAVAEVVDGMDENSNDAMAEDENSRDTSEVTESQEDVESQEPLSNFSVYFSGDRKNCVDEGSSLVLGLSSEERLAFLGMARVKVLAGQASVNGALLTSGRGAEMICPRSAPVPVLNAISDGKASRQSGSKAKRDSASSADTYPLPSSDLLSQARLPPSWDPTKFACTIRITPHLPNEVGLEQIGLVCPYALGHGATTTTSGAMADAALPSPFEWSISPGSDARPLVKPLFVPVYDRVAAIPSLPNPRSSSGWGGSKNKSASLPFPPIRVLKSDPVWEAAENRVLKHPKSPVVIVHGPKGSGKSTLAQRLLSVLRTRRLSASAVAFLDLDPGQPEFGPAGQISLHVFHRDTESDILLGPRWATLHAPQRAHWLGVNSGLEDPRAYLDAAKNLVQLYQCLRRGQTPEAPKGTTKRRKWRSEVAASQASAKAQGQEGFPQEMPLIINTMGWSKGLGADLERQIVQFVEPTHVICLSDGKGQVNLLTPAELGIKETETVMHVPVHGIKEPAHIASDNRTLSIMSYLFSTRLAKPGFALPQWDFRLPLLARPPLVAQVPRAFPRGVCLPLHSGHTLGTPQEINARLVGLVRTQSDPRYMEQSECLGMGLVRAVEESPAGEGEGAQVSAIHLLTPVSAQALSEAKEDLALVTAGPSVPTPIWAFLDAPECRASFWSARAKEWSHSQGEGASPELTIAGQPLSLAPFLEWPADWLPAGLEAPRAPGSKKRSSRRNVQRRVHQR